MNPCTKKWLIEALRRTKPIIQELGFPAYSTHYITLFHEATTPLQDPDIAKQFTAEKCDPDTTLTFLQDLETISNILAPEIDDMVKQEIELAYNPKFQANLKLLLGSNEEEEEEEEEEFWEDDDEEEEDPWEEEEDWEDEVEEWDIDEEEEVLAWWCEDQDCRTITKCTNHGCYKEEDP
jgi:hypothetical protein